MFLNEYLRITDEKISEFETFPFRHLHKKVIIIVIILLTVSSLKLGPAEQKINEPAKGAKQSGQ